MTGLLAVEERPAALLARLVGIDDLTAAHAGRLETEVTTLPRADVVVLDLSSLRHLDAAGIGVLVRWERRLAASGSQLRLAAPGRGAATVLELLRLHRLFEVYDGVDEALRDDDPLAW